MAKDALNIFGGEIRSHGFRAFHGATLNSNPKQFKQEIQIRLASLA
jgi:hypothetical protein